MTKMRFYKSEFVRNVLTLTTGTGVAQVIPVAIAPILTRLYSPEDFGILALFMAVSATLALLATGRYELAIILPDEDSDAAHVTAVAAMISISVTLITFFIFLYLNHPIARLLKSEPIAKWLTLIPLMIFLNAMQQILSYWANRKKQFQRLAWNRIWLSVGTGAASLGFGFALGGGGGLILGTLVGQGFATALLGIQTWRLDGHYATKIRKAALKEQANRYSNFPKFSVAADLINTIANQLPIFLLGAFFGPRVLGLFSLTHRVLAKPVSILSDSVLEVFKQKASREYIRNGRCDGLFVKTIKRLSWMSIIPFAFLFFAAPWFFAFIFGEEWRIAGEYARIMTPLFALRFTISPVSYILYIAQKQKYDLIWQICLLIVTAAGLYLGHIMGRAELSISFFTAFYGLMYVVYALMSYHFSKGNIHPSAGAVAL